MNRSLAALVTLMALLVFISAACTLTPDNGWQSGPATLPAPLSLPPNFLAAGLKGLQSYRASIVMEFEGTRGRQPIQGRVESLLETTRRPEALHQYLKVQTSLADPEGIAGESEFYRLGNQVLVKKGNPEQWFSFTDAAVSPAQLGFVALERLITLPPQLEQAPQPEILNGQPVQRYSFSAADLSDPNLSFETAQGDLWLARSGDYLAQYVLSATLRVIIPNPSAHLFDQGRLNLRYTLSDVNAAFEIQPPPGVLTHSSPLSPLPRLPDAALVSVFPTLLEYTTASSPISTTLFYQDQMPKLGWTEVVSQSEVFKEKARLNFSKAGQTLTILITPVEENLTTKILLELPPD